MKTSLFFKRLLKCRLIVVNVLSTFLYGISSKTEISLLENCLILTRTLKKLNKANHIYMHKFFD